MKRRALCWQALGSGGDGEQGPGGEGPAVSADPFEVLGMTKEGATPEDVAKAFKKMAITWHPAGAYTRSEFSST